MTAWRWLAAGALSVGSIAMLGITTQACADDSDAGSDVSPDASGGGGGGGGGEGGAGDASGDASLDANADAEAFVPPAEIAAILAKVPNLVVCQPGAQPWINQTEEGTDTTYFHRCAAPCADWRSCTTETDVRGTKLVELAFVVDEDGSGNGFGGSLRFSKNGARDHLVMFHKGGSGTEWVDDFLPAKVEAAGGTSFEPKWIKQGVGWFARPSAGSKLERNLYGVSARVAAVIKWGYLNVAKSPIASVGCSGGSIATYYPRHWHGLDPVFRYQLLSGGPVMSKIEAGCRGGAASFGRCTRDPDKACDATNECGPGGGTCSSYEWGSDLVMTAVRATIDHLHANETSGAKSCLQRTPQAAFGASDFDSPAHAYDDTNEHRIDFMANVGIGDLADDDINVVASSAAVYASLKGAKSWTTQPGTHCDTLKTEEAWGLVRAGAGFP